MSTANFKHINTLLKSFKEKFIRNLYCKMCSFSTQNVLKWICEPARPRPTGKLTVPSQTIKLKWDGGRKRINTDKQWIEDMEGEQRMHPKYLLSPSHIWNLALHYIKISYGSINQSINQSSICRGGSGTSQMGPKGGHNSSWMGRGAQYAAELRIYWCILQLN